MTTDQVADPRQLDASLDELIGSPAFVVNPYPIYARLRRESPVHWVEAWGCWLLTRADDIDATIRDTTGFSSADRVTRVIERMPDWERRLPALHQNFAVGMAQRDPPDHTRIRGLVSAAFTPRRVEQLRDRIATHVDRFVDGVAETGRMELIADLAQPLPAIVIAEMAGFPVEDRERFRDWTNRINAFFFASGIAQPEAGDAANRAIEEARAWIAPLLEARRAEPRDDLLTALAAVEVDGTHLTEAELLSTAITLFLGGHDTTTGLIALGLNALVRHPDQLAYLRAHPERIDAAVEEMLRFDAPFQLNLRYVTEDLEIRGQRLRSGELVRQALGAANRDPDRFSEPDDFRLDRPPSRHLAFGLGPHFCLGASLARLQARIAIDTMVRRLPGLRLDPGADPSPDVRPDVTNRTLRSLRLAFDPPA